MVDEAALALGRARAERLGDDAFDVGRPSDGTAAVSGQQPSVRKRTLFIFGTSPGSSGRRSSSTTSSWPLRMMVGRWAAK